MGIPLLLVLTLAWSADRRQAARLAGLAIGLAVALKVFMAVILVSLCIRRQWRTLAWSAAGAGIATAVGLRARRRRRLSWMAPGALQSATDDRVSVERLAPGICSVGASPIHRLSTCYLWMMAATIVGLATVALLWRVRDDTDRSWGDCGGGGHLAFPLGWIYYFPILTPALVALWTRGSRIALSSRSSLLMVPVLQSPNCSPQSG